MTTETGASATWLTREAYERLTGSLETMRGSTRAEVVARIEAAREEGDLRENGGYHAAKEEQGKLEARIRQLTVLLRDVRVGEQPTGERVEEGCVVGVDYGDGDVERFLFASRENATDEGGRIGDLDVYSPESPIGQAIAGHRAGDEVVFGPRSLKVRIVSVEPFEEQ
ncbi:MAG: GreA/GreB family elongation factor [Actinomycetota bacterium]|nr:GreA/GreB family elongation factor [Actinomycetota bacterium]